VSPLADAAADYLRLRRALGHKLAEHERLLPRLVAFLEAAGAQTVTVAAALDWASERDSPPGSTVPARRMTIARGFARYLAGTDPAAEVPPPGMAGHRRHRRVPYIYTEADISALTALARQVIRAPLRAATIATLIGLLDATGMRIGEAITLDRGDIDWTGAVLTIRESKFGKSRLVPLHDSAAARLREYARIRGRLMPHPGSGAFFTSLTGTRLLYPNIHHTFSTLVRLAGTGTGSPATPRIHDIRHSFAVRTLLRWYRDGHDVQSRLPWLSAYLGHREPRHTYWYLTGIPELLALAAERLEKPEGDPPS
jgi:integrase/recombinase XerD